MLTSRDMAELLANKRDDAGLTQQDLSDLSGIHRSTITKFECGNSLESFILFSRALASCGCDLDIKLKTRVPYVHKAKVRRFNTVRSAS